MDAADDMVRPEDNEPRHRRRWYEPLSISAYAWRLGVVDFVVWLLLLWVVAGAIFYWAAGPQGVLEPGPALALGGWSFFFAGLVGRYSADLQGRRALLVGMVYPSSQECREAAALPAGPRLLSFWAPAWGWALLGGLAGTCLLGLGLDLRDWSPVERSQFLLGCALLPALLLGLVAAHGCRQASLALLAARRNQLVRQSRPRRFLWFEAVLPYLPVSTVMGVLAAWARFGGRPAAVRRVPVDELALHLGLTSLLLGLLLPAVAAFKVRVDLLGPLAWSSPLPSCRRRYRWQAAPVLALLVYALVQGGGRLWSPGGLALPLVLLLKALVCLGVATPLVAWAVYWEMSRPGPHPYFARSRRLAAARKRLAAGQLPGDG